MSYIVTFDIGTTSIKGILLDKKGSARGEMSFDIETLHGPKGEMEQSPIDWWKGITTIASKWWKQGIYPQEIKIITFSGQMQDVIPVSSVSHPTANAILYSDNRAVSQAERLNTELSNIREITGNHIDSASPFAKLLWLKEHEPEKYRSSNHFLFSSKDYIIYELTKSVVTDPVTGATTGMMDIHSKDWHAPWLAAQGISRQQLPKICYPDQLVGKIDKEAAKATGFLEGTPVLCGCGDAGATTVGAGAVRDGSGYIYIGTTGWIALPTNSVKQQKKGIFNLVHPQKGKYISIAPLLNVGNVFQWGVQTFAGSNQESMYDQFEGLVQKAQPGSNGLLFLPYLHGERFPIHDPQATGAYYGINPLTTREDFARALLEGLSFSFRQTFEIFLKQNKERITLIGGGTKSEEWCQILANVLGQQIRIPANSEYLPVIGAASSAFVYLNWTENYEQFVEQILISKEDRIYAPDLNYKPEYDALYEKFVKLYPALKQV